MKAVQSEQKIGGIMLAFAPKLIFVECSEEKKIVPNFLIHLLIKMKPPQKV